MTTDRTAWTTADASEFPELPYPGIRPAGSWRLTTTGRLHRLDQLSDRSVRDRVTGETISLSGRLLILAYGSNGSPRKLRSKYPGEEVFALSAEVKDWAAVWCSQRRRSGEAVCTLERVPGTREAHVVLAVTPAQLHQMDIWEGHPRYYERSDFPAGVTLDCGARPPGIQVYLGTPGKRPALLAGGLPLRCSEAPYDEADRMVGR